MNYLRLLFLTLTSVSLVPAAAYPLGREIALSRICSVDNQMAENVIREGDNPEALPGVFGRYRMADSEQLRDLFNLVIQHGRIRSFEFLLARMAFETPAERDRTFTYLLRSALRKSNVEIAGILLAQGFQIERREGMLFWHLPLLGPRPPLDLEAINQFISNHRDQATSMAPTNSDMKHARNGTEASLLIDLALHCDTVSGQQTFDATKFLTDGVLCSWLDDAEMSQIALRLLHCGADVDRDTVDNFAENLPDHDYTIQLLRSWAGEDVKVTEEEANLVCD